MSAWTLYWVLMLDNIGCLAGFVAGAAGMAFAFCVFFAVPLSFEPVEDGWKIWRRFFIPTIVTMLISLPVATLLPSTKQAAVILIVPRIATEENLQALQDETGELYGMAKEWLKDQTNKAEKE